MTTSERSERASRSQATLERALGVAFENARLLEQALTHRSYIHEHPEAGAETNERLEFLGDAIFQFLIADLLYQRFPEAAEGTLTVLRQALVSTESFASVGETLGLASAVRASRGEATLRGRGRASILAGCVEALVAAVYLDRGLDTAREVVSRLLEPRLESVLRDETPINVKGRLQEILAQRGEAPEYRVVERSGPSHAEKFVVEVVAGKRVLGRGEGVGKRQAEHRAAREALAAIESRDGAAIKREVAVGEVNKSSEGASA
jgi:ribonuclease III